MIMHVSVFPLCILSCDLVDQVDLTHCGVVSKDLRLNK